MSTPRRVLVAVPDRQDLRHVLRCYGWAVETAPPGRHCLDVLAEREHQALLLGPNPGDGSLEHMLEHGRRQHPDLVVVLLRDGCSPQEAMRLARLGLDEYLPSDTPPEVVAQRLSELADARRAVESEALRANGTALIGRSRAMRQVAEVARLIAARRSTVLITGPTGTGKELVARLIHNLSPRAGRPMVTVNCGAIPEHLLEAEFFGHVKGAFTGAVATRIGRFEQAQGSTLFLDEIGDMPIELQAKVLRAVQEREFQRVGSSETVQVDVRVIAATNQDLTEKVRKGEFREDLYYRLNVVPVAMPPLADRLEDVPSLVHHFLEKVARREALPRKNVAPEALDRLTQYHWPGNVRQLENVVEKAAVLSGERQELYTSDFALPAPEPRLDSRVPTAVDLPPGGLDLNEYLSQVELHLLRQALERAGGNKNRAAQFLRLKRTTLSAKLKSCRAAKL